MTGGTEMNTPNWIKLPNGSYGQILFNTDLGTYIERFISKEAAEFYHNQIKELCGTIEQLIYDIDQGAAEDAINARELLEDYGF